MIKDGVMIYCDECSSYTCGCPEAKEIESLRQQLTSRDAEIAALKVVSDHNLHIYQEAASKMRAEIAELNNRLVTLGGIASTHVGEKEKLHQQVKMLRDVLDDKQWAKDGDVHAHNKRVQEALAATGEGK